MHRLRHTDVDTAIYRLRFAVRHVATLALLCLLAVGCAEGTPESEPAWGGGTGGDGGLGNGASDAGDEDAGGDGDATGDGDGDATGDGDGDATGDGDGATVGGRRIALTIQGSEVPGGLIGFPVLVRLDETDLATHAEPDGSDIHFVDDAGADLPFEIESYAAGALVAWVRMDLTSNDQTFYIQYGSADGAAANPSALWSGFAAVYHMNYGGGPGTQPDSTANANDLESVDGREPAGLAIGRIGPALTWGTGVDWMIAPDGPSLDMGSQITISAWINPTGNAPGRPETFLAKRPVNTEEVNYQVGLGGDARRLSFFHGQWNPNPSASDQSVPAGAWTHIAVTVVDSTGTVQYWINGVLAQEKGDAKLRPNDRPLYVGGQDQETDEGLQGHLDEVRITGALRHQAWIVAEYNNQKAGSTFIAVGTPEAR